jgi:hypothetical protein
MQACMPDRDELPGPLDAAGSIMAAPGRADFSIRAQHAP